MALFPCLRAAFSRWSAWREANSRKPLKQMSSTYLATVAAPSAAVVMLMQPPLSKATDLFLDQLLPVAPWHLNLAVAVLVLAWWTMLGMSALLAATHGRALGERMFNTSPNA